MIASLAVAAIIVLRSHVAFEAELSRSPGSTFVLDDDGSIRNTYLLNIGNNDPRAGTTSYTVSLEGLPGALVLAPPIDLANAQDRTVPVIVRMPRDQGPARSLPFTLRVSSGQQDRVLRATFMTPGRGAGPEAP